MMLSFLFAVMLLVSLVILLEPLTRSGDAMPPRQEFDLAICRDQLAEIERDAQSGLLPSEQLAAVRVEIQRRALAAAALPERKASLAGVRWIGFGTLLFIALGSVIIYGYLGSPQVPSAPFADRRSDTVSGMNDFQQNRMIRTMVEGLALKLQTNVDDLEGWEHLAQAYRVLGETKKAEHAEQKIERLKRKRAGP